MGKRGEKYKLMGEIEIDDAFFTTVDLDRDKEEEMKRGRGSPKIFSMKHNVCFHSRPLRLASGWQGSVSSPYFIHFQLFECFQNSTEQLQNLLRLLYAVYQLLVCPISNPYYLNRETP
jgi:hypothetical protein